MANLNKVLLMGNLTRDPELKFLQSGTAVCDFGLAVNRKWRTPQGESKEEVTFVDVTVFGKTGENVAQYCKKGRPVFVEGRLKFDSWTSKDGQKRSKLSVTGESVQFLGGREDKSAPRGDAAEDFDVDDASIPF